MGRFVSEARTDAAAAYRAHPLRAHPLHAHIVRAEEQGDTGYQGTKVQAHIPLPLPLTCDSQLFSGWHRLDGERTQLLNCPREVRGVS